MVLHWSLLPSVQGLVLNKPALVINIMYGHVPCKDPREKNQFNKECCIRPFDWARFQCERPLWCNNPFSFLRRSAEGWYSRISYLAEPKELVGACQVEVIDCQAVSLWHSADRAVIDLHGAASQAIVLLQLRVLREERPALLRGCLRAQQC